MVHLGGDHRIPSKQPEPIEMTVFSMLSSLSAHLCLSYVFSSGLCPGLAGKGQDRVQ